MSVEERKNLFLALNRNFLAPYLILNHASARADTMMQV